MYLSAREASAILGVSNVTMSLWCREGRVPGVIKIKGQWLIPANITLDDIDRPRMGRPRKAVETLPPPESKNGRSQEENGR